MDFKAKFSIYSHRSFVLPQITRPIKILPTKPCIANHFPISVHRYLSLLAFGRKKIRHHTSVRCVALWSEGRLLSRRSEQQMFKTSRCWSGEVKDVYESGVAVCTVIPSSGLRPAGWPQLLSSIQDESQDVNTHSPLWEKHFLNFRLYAWMWYKILFFFFGLSCSSDAGVYNSGFKTYSTVHVELFGIMSIFFMTPNPKYIHFKTLASVLGQAKNIYSSSSLIWTHSTPDDLNRLL